MEQKCEICGGVGVIEKDGKLVECECAIVKRIAMSMPQYIRLAKVTDKHLSSNLVNRFNKTTFIIGSWNDMRSIIKIMYIKYSNKFIKITSDREIRDVFVGSKSRSARGDSDEVYNNLEDLVNTPDLIVIKLNEIAYKNKAAPGALEEALIFRMDRGKPMWIFSDINRPFSSASYSYSDNVMGILTDLDKETVSSFVSAPMVSLDTESTLEYKEDTTEAKNDTKNDINLDYDTTDDIEESSDDISSIYATKKDRKWKR